ncbi:hypothetical protein C8J35_101542 [Rhizobium sp. PP-F2F-G38]|uniref:DUF1127 domain-containing protein n=1 Tax=Ferranicluibacter rubi TaxID=2715133 RepID=A0AA44CD29_9HYPH|nr:hypothetical protein [Ferranicluibacter rubi]PYE37273.1 hypothetical protein C8J37_101543 [Rhizobium sp. PP-WC-1G-195]PYF00725.1 hypothetical protein C8J35_101542 [Rhizobium sp. PP-F2F-G38]TCP90590.1 hypothetical protein C8J31_101433 [Rhizobium sp. PP-CC-2G-626]TCQ27951.1 hypothetical protein C8J33_101583 [Rhizobium sp. PP-CC-3G-465]NHT78469.1 hypothetical protein [Ferranicluibacter rubi]
MSTFSLSSSPSTPSFGSRALAGATSLAHRIVKTWQDRRSERALASLSYDTLKDIGFPASTDSRNTPAQ